MEGNDRLPFSVDKDSTHVADLQSRGFDRRVLPARSQQSAAPAYLVGAQLSPEQSNMTNPSREEMDAKLEAVEARTETRFLELNGKLDRVLDMVSAASDRSRTEIGGLRADIASVKADNRFTRWTIVGVVLASMIAAVAALWTTQSNLLSAFQTGISLHSTIVNPSAAK